MRRTRVLFVSAVAALALVSCGASSQGPRGDSGTTLLPVVLRDGTPCVFMDGAESKALSCGWAKPGPSTGVDPRGDRGTTITLAVMPDGTRCAVADGRPGKALSCDWK